MKIFIKNMVCQGTRKFVLKEIKKLGFRLISFESGELEFSGELSPVETNALERSLNKYGLEMSLRSHKPESLFAFNPLGSLMNDEDFFESSDMVMEELTRAV